MKCSSRPSPAAGATTVSNRQVLLPIIYPIAAALVVCTTVAVAGFGDIDIPDPFLLVAHPGPVLPIGWLYRSIALILSAEMAGTGPAVSQ